MPQAGASLGVMLKTHPEHRSTNRMLSDMESGDVILIEQVDRLSGLNDADGENLKRRVFGKEILNRHGFNKHLGVI